MDVEYLLRNLIVVYEAVDDRIHVGNVLLHHAFVLWTIRYPMILEWEIGEKGNKEQGNKKKSFIWRHTAAHTIKGIVYNRL